MITAQSTLLSNERLATQLLGQQMVTSVYLVKALGGAWDASEIQREQVDRRWFRPCSSNSAVGIRAHPRKSNFLLSSQTADLARIGRAEPRKSGAGYSNGELALARSTPSCGVPIFRSANGSRVPQSASPGSRRRSHRQSLLRCRYSS